jgi:hypothetical protein
MQSINSGPIAPPLDEQGLAPMPKWVGSGGGVGNNATVSPGSSLSSFAGSSLAEGKRPAMAALARILRSAEQSRTSFPGTAEEISNPGSNSPGSKHASKGVMQLEDPAVLQNQQHGPLRDAPPMSVESQAKLQLEYPQLLEEHPNRPPAATSGGNPSTGSILADDPNTSPPQPATMLNPNVQTILEEYPDDAAEPNLELMLISGRCSETSE